MMIDPNEISLTPEQREFVAARAEATGTPWRDLLSELIPVDTSKNGEGNGETAFDLASRLGLVGASDSGPSDLATNPTHMEGFGESDHSSSLD